MISDFKNVTDILMSNISSGASIYYANVLKLLFGAYLLESKIYSFDNSTACKLHKGTQRVNPKMSEFYINSDKEIMKRDIESFIGYIFDKPNTYRELYCLIENDDTLSTLFRRDILKRLSEQYTDDNSLIEIITESLYIAVTRRYKKAGKFYSAERYSDLPSAEKKVG